MHILKQFYGKSLTNIRAYGIDEFDFTPNLIGTDFSVGQFGYAVFEFGDSCIYISADGLSADLPPGRNVYELPVDNRIQNCFIGAVLESVEFDGEIYRIQFSGFEILEGYYSPNDEHTDRHYFNLEFSWI